MHRACAHRSLRRIDINGNSLNLVPPPTHFLSLTMKTVSSSILVLAGATVLAAGVLSERGPYEVVGGFVGLCGLVAWVGSFFLMRDIER